MGYVPGRNELGVMGSVFADTANGRITPPTGKVFIAITFIADTQLETLGTNAGGLTGDTSDADYDIAVAIASPGKGSEWTNANGKQAIGYKVKGLKTDSMSISSSIGDNKSVSLTATAQVGGPTDSENGLFIYASGVVMGTTP